MTSAALTLLNRLYRLVLLRARRTPCGETRRWVGLEQLEQRILYSVTPPGADLLLDQVAMGDSQIVIDDSETNLTDGEAGEHTAEESRPRRELVFIDSRVPDSQTLIDELLTDHGDGREIEVIVLDADRDGIEQIGEALNRHQDLDAVHIFSHGTDAAVQLGDGWLDSGDLASRAGEIGDWGESLSPDADLLFYGCDLASSEDGRALTESLAKLTGADVAASIDLTGSDTLGGDWDLEYATGTIDVSTPLSGAFTDGFKGVLTAGDSLWLTTTGDVSAPDGVPGLPAWSAGEVLEFGDPNLALDPATGTTAGTFTPAFNLDSFVVGSDATVNAVHYVSLDIQVGSSNFQLRAGDLLLSTEGGQDLTSLSIPTDANFTNDLSVTKADVFVFRPDTAGDYSSGTFALLLEDPGGGGHDIRGISLVEKDTPIGDTIVHEGDFLFTSSRPSLDTSVFLLETDDIGTGPNGTVRTLLDGKDKDIGVAKHFSGVDLVETEVTIGGTTLHAGTILLTVNGTDTVGSNKIGIGDHDVFALQVTKSTLVAGAGKAAATATLVFDGSDVDLNVAEERLAGLTLVTGEQLNATGGVSTTAPVTQTTDEDTALVFSAANSNAITVDDGNPNDGVLRTTLTVTNGTLTLGTTSGIAIVAGAEGTATITIVGLESAVNNALDGLTYDPTGDYSGPADLDVTTDFSVGLQGHYTFESENPPGNDSSPNGTNGGAVSGATVTSDGTRGDVLSFDGDDFVEVSGLYGEPQAVTLAAWVQLDSGNSNGEVISLGNNVVLRLDELNNSHGVEAGFYNGTNWDLTPSGTYISGTGWHHVAYTYDNATNEQVLYIDGLAVATTSFTDAVSYSLGTDTTLGRHSQGNSYFLNGDLDDARVYDRALSGQEILALSQDQANDSASVEITVKEVNDTAPVVTPGQSFNVSEDAADTAVIGTVVATDADTKGTLGNWAITAGNGDGIFEIDAASGQISILDNTNLDRETTNSYALTVQLDDGVNTSATETVAITIDDANDTAPVMTFSQTFNINEAAGNGDPVGTVAATDPDTVGSLTGWTILSGNDDGIFTIGSTTGRITIADNTNLDYETTTSYVLTLQVGDGVNSSATETVTINIDDANDTAPYIPQGQAFNINEAASDGDTVGTVVATDPDTVGSLTGWTILSGNDDGVFAIDASSGQITIADSATLDADTTPAYFLELRVGDGANDSSVEVVTIDVSSDPGPTGTIEDVAAAEDDPDAAIDLFAAFSDAEDADADLAYTVLSNTNTGLFTSTIIDAASGTLMLSYTPDQHGAADLTVRVTDTRGNFQDTTFSVTVDPVNDEPVIVTNTGTALVSNGSVVVTSAMLEVRDVDNLPSELTYTLTAAPDHGELQLDGAAMTAGDTFTQEGIDTGRVTYHHDGTATLDGFGFIVSDTAGVAGGSGDFDVTAIAPTLATPPPDVLAAPARVVDVVEEDAVDTDETTDEETEDEITEEEAIATVTAESPTVAEDSGEPARSASSTSLPINGAGTNLATPAASPTTAQRQAPQDEPSRPDGTVPEAEHSESVARPYGAEDAVTPRAAILGLPGRAKTSRHGALFDELDQLSDQLNSSSEFEVYAAGSATLVVTGMSAGYLVSLVRGGHLLASVLSSMPAWQLVDPLPILDSLGADMGDAESDEDSDSLASMIDRASSEDG